MLASKQKEGNRETQPVASAVTFLQQLEPKPHKPEATGGLIQSNNGSNDFSERKSLQGEGRRSWNFLKKKQQHQVVTCKIALSLPPEFASELQGPAHQNLDISSHALTLNARAFRRPGLSTPNFLRNMAVQDGS